MTVQIDNKEGRRYAPRAIILIKDSQLDVPMRAEIGWSMGYSTTPTEKRNEEHRQSRCIRAAHILDHAHKMHDLLERLAAVDTDEAFAEYRSSVEHVLKQIAQEMGEV